MDTTPPDYRALRLGSSIQMTSRAICRRDVLQVCLSGRRRSHPEAGFTLVELLVVLAILVLLATYVGPRVIGYLGSSRTQAAKVQIESIASALELYRLDVGKYPSSEEGLKALVERPSDVTIWNGPYLRKQSVPLDPWGRSYQYRAPGQHGGVDVFTFGADNQQGGTGENADVTSW